MKNFFLFILFVLTLQACIRQDKQFSQENLNDFCINSFPLISIKDSITKQFVKDFIDLPENINRKVFTIFFDQRADTLNLTIFRYLRRYITLDNCIGHFRFEGKVILLYSPFTDLMSIKEDKAFEKELNQLYKSELEYYKNHRHELVMWQLQYSYYYQTFDIIKGYHRISNTLKPVLHDSIKVDIQWPAD